MSQANYTFYRELVLWIEPYLCKVSMTMSSLAVIVIQNPEK